MQAENRSLREQRSETWKQVLSMVRGDIGFGCEGPEGRFLLVRGAAASDRDWERFQVLVDQTGDLNEQIEGIERSGDNVKQTEFRGKEFGASRLGPPPHGQIGEFAPEGRESKEHREAFQSYLRLGGAEMRADQRALLAEHRDMGTGGQGAFPGATAGFFVPVGFFNDVEDALKYYGPMLNGGEGMPFLLDTDTGQPLPYPAADDTLQVGEQLNENSAVTTQDVNLQMVMFGAWKYSTKLVKVSLELLQDSAFDVEAFLSTEFGRRLGRIVNTKVTIGTGSGEPMGIVPAIVGGGNVCQAVGSYANDGVGLGNSIGSDDLVSLEHQVDPVYRLRGRYMMNDSVLKRLKQIKDKFGRPLLWQEGTREGSPATVNGYPYCINNDMDQLQTVASSPVVTRRTMVFGDLSKHVIRRVKQLSVLRLSERFADFGQVAFIGFARYDANSLDIGHRAQAILENVF
jgi:HK97 family phage major capsid protein